MSDYQCTGCLQVKPTTAFHAKATRRGHYTRCKDCVNDVQRARVARGVVLPRDQFVSRACVGCLVVKDADGFTISEFSRDGYMLTCKRCKLLWIDHKLTGSAFQALLDAQSGLCAICEQVMEVVNVDHDHSCCPRRRSCGKCVRGLLCPTCNRGLGLFKDSAKSLLAAASYIEKAGDHHQ